MGRRRTHQEEGRDASPHWRLAVGAALAALLALVVLSPAEGATGVALVALVEAAILAYAIATRKDGEHTVPSPAIDRPDSHDPAEGTHASLPGETEASQPHGGSVRSQQEDPSQGAGQDAGPTDARGKEAAATGTQGAEATVPDAPGQQSAPSEEADKPRTSTFDLDALTTRLLQADDAVRELKAQVGDIRTRQAKTMGQEAGGDVREDATDVLAPSELELYYARVLEEAGLFAHDVEVPRLSAVRLHRSGLFYLRSSEQRYPYLAKLRIISLEAALNAVRFAIDFSGGSTEVSERTAMRVNQGITTSIVSQMPDIDEPMPLQEDESPDGEWAVRRGIATAMESFRLPYRLVADYRVNVRGGDVAFQLDLTPAACFPRSAWIEGLGRVVPTTTLMRQREADAYGIRVGILLAAAAFRCSSKVQRVWVAGVETTATTRSCLYSVTYDRARFRTLDLTKISDPIWTMASFGARMDSLGGTLHPVRQTFSLDDERFCPPRRYEPISVSQRTLGDAARKALGTPEVRGLAIHEETARELVAEDFGRHLGDSTEQSVHAILAAAQKNPAADVQEAARRTVSRLIAGTLSDESPLGIEDDFANGDDLTRAVARAEERAGRQDYAGAMSILERALQPLDERGAYEDTDQVAHRFFRSYADRVMFNRLYALPGQAVELVPDAYYEAHLMMGMGLLSQGEHEASERHARLLVRIAPVDVQARLLLARDLGMRGDLAGAVREAKELLGCAYEPEALAGAYSALGQCYQQEDDLVTAAACYRRSMRWPSSCYLASGIALSQIAQQSPTQMATELGTDDQVDVALTAAGIPLAPTEHVSGIFLDGMRASMDAEVFPVAKNFVDVLGLMSGDDVVLDIDRSLEGEPDR